MTSITDCVRSAVKKSGVKSGICVVYCPHTTAGITITENTDSEVSSDIMYGLAKSFPNWIGYKHYEGNSAAHLLSSVIGASAVLIVEGCQPILGPLQGIYFCEFYGNQRRKYFVKVIADK
jgi:secondary thiamine-phosphate synthase enzyme